MKTYVTQSKLFQMGFKLIDKKQVDNVVTIIKIGVINIPFGAKKCPMIIFRKTNPRFNKIVFLLLMIFSFFGVI